MLRQRVITALLLAPLALLVILWMPARGHDRGVWRCSCWLVRGNGRHFPGCLRAGTHCVYAP